VKRLEWYIARRYLASRRKGRFLSLITLIAVAGILLGVTALITVIAVMTGLQTDLQAKILGANPHIFVFQQGPSFRMTDWQKVLATVKLDPAVVAAEPFIMTQVGVMPNANYAQFGTLFGIDAKSTNPPMTDVERQIREGKLAFGPTQSGLPGILIGSHLAQRLGVLRGDVVTVVAMENLKQDPFGNPMPVVRRFEVTGLFTTGMYEYDNENMYAAMPAVQDLLGLTTQVSGVAVDVKDPWHARSVARDLDKRLDPIYYSQDWLSLNSSLFSALKLEKLAMAVILFLIVVVAAFNIISTLIMVVTDKTREIGILKAMGMTDAGVLRIFMMQGLTIGVVGTVLGAAGGLLLVWLLGTYHFISLPGDVYFIDTLPVNLQPRDLAVTILASIAIAFAATIYPAKQASRLLPVEAIRHE
jgi:lipoprotein-releasing system permease protein